MTKIHSQQSHKNNFAKLDLIWLIIFISIAFVVTIFIHENGFSTSVMLSGVLCVALIAIGRKEGYIVGLYNSFSYAWLAYQNGLFGELFLNIGFFVPTGIIGFFMWKSNSSNQVVKMRELAVLAKLKIFGACLFCFLGLGYFLSTLEGQNNPYLDASTNVLSIIATLLMMWRFKEQWVLYIILNVTTVVLWILRWLEGGQAGDIMIMMWCLFLANSLYGYWRWNKGAKLQTEDVAS